MLRTETPRRPNGKPRDKFISVRERAELIDLRQEKAKREVEAEKEKVDKASSEEARKARLKRKLDASRKKNLTASNRNERD